MIKAVIFDIDGVLLDSFEANLRFYQDLMIKAGYRPPTKEKFQHLFHLTLIGVIKIITKSSSETEINRIFELGKSHKMLRATEPPPMIKNAEKVVDILHKKYLLGIVTSRIKETVYESPELAKLQKHFKVAVSYQDTINHKPHPEPLLLAAKKLEVRPEECVYVGDVENDIKAGKDAGMKTILYSKNKLEIADYCTPSLEDLPSIISNLQ